MNTKTKTFKDLIVWKKSYDLCIRIYKTTSQFPSFELYGLGQQMRRSSVSIPSNISEGYGRIHKNEYRQFLSIAYGSLCELETQYLLSVSLDYIEKDEIIENFLKEVGSMLYRLLHPIY